MLLGLPPLRQERGLGGEAKSRQGELLDKANGFSIFNT